MPLYIKAEDLDARSLVRVADVLRADGVVCFPTDTVYGLAVDPRSRRAVDRLFEVKGRSREKPILLLVDSIKMVRAYAVANTIFTQMAEAFWPGPITLVTRAAPSLPGSLTADRGTIGLRWPKAPTALALIGALGAAISGTSANQSGQPVATSAAEAVSQLGDDIDVVIDGGLLDRSLTSTVMDLTSKPPSLLREGAIGYAVLEEFLSGAIARRSA